MSIDKAAANPTTSTQAPKPDSTSLISKPKTDSPTILEDFERLTPEEIADVRRLMKRDSLLEARNSYWLEHLFWWSPSWSMWGSTESRMIQAEFIKSGSPSITQNIGNEVMMCNKATAFYSMESAQTIPGDAKGLDILGSIFKYWTEALGRQPYVQLDAFFDAPISVKAKSATTFPEILYGHKCIYSHAQELLRGQRMGRQIDLRYFRLHPLFEALITVFDKYRFVEWFMKIEEDGCRHYDNVAQHQSILLIRTGREDKLSAPISFETLKHQALPIARDEDLGVIDITHVPLQTSVRFATDLLLREDAAHPESALANTKKSLDSPFADWEQESQKN
jgi:hypothetical protein